MLGFYASLNLQWHNYKIERVLFHHAHAAWHLLYFIIPVLLYYGLKNFFWLAFYVLYLPAMYIWYRKMDKKLVFTARIKRFFALLLLAVLVQDLLCFFVYSCPFLGVIFALFVPLGVSFLYEANLRRHFIKKAARKVQGSSVKIVAITASYGKTSIKHYLYALLKDSFKTQMTPRSVNTDIGIAKEINEQLLPDTEIFIAEAGARLRGDILKISGLLNHQYAILGEVGEQHIEYFKTLDAVRATKQEILRSSRLSFTLAHETSLLNPAENVVIYSKAVSNVRASLEGVSWDLSVRGRKISLHAGVLGAFNAYNISAAFLMALTLGANLEDLVQKVSKLEGVEHRLQRMPSADKLIIDDSFNGNLKGMLEACSLAALHKGRKVIVTPGIVESDAAANEAFALKVSQIFDLVIITGSANMGILSRHIAPQKRIRLYDKSQLVKTLATQTRAGDLILFANDTPTFM